MLLQCAEFAKAATDGQTQTVPHENIMEQIMTSPVLRHSGRPTSHAVITPQDRVSPEADQRWHLLDLVRQCRRRLGLRDRDIAVLRGLLSLMPKAASPDQRVVFASNRVLIERCDGIDERTLRRRLQCLRAKGLIDRHSSPNGKRFQVRDDLRNLCLSYGIDLGPLFLLQPELEALSEACAREQSRIVALRAMIRDALYHCPANSDPALLEHARLSLRRAIDSQALQHILVLLQALLPVQPAPATREATQKSSHLTASDSQNDRHIQRSDKESLDSDRQRPENSEPAPARASKKGAEKTDITVAQCMDLAQTAKCLAPTPLRNWEDVIALARTLAPAIGLGHASVSNAENQLGRHGCALAILGLVEAVGRIRKPEAYLRALAKQAQTQAFDVVGMFRSLVSPSHRSALRAAI